MQYTLLEPRTGSSIKEHLAYLTLLKQVMERFCIDGKYITRKKLTEKRRKERGTQGSYSKSEHKALHNILMSIQHYEAKEAEANRS